MNDVTRQAVVALGSNLGGRELILARAIEGIGQRVGTVLTRSRWLETEAMIHPDDPTTTYPPFLNGCALVSTALHPLAILGELHAVEASLGRDRAEERERWRPRLIDLDLIALDDVTSDDPELQLPHPGMHTRRFVLEPMAEIWPEWRHPRLGRTVAQLLAELPA